MGRVWAMPGGGGGVVLSWTGAKMGKNRLWETEKESYVMNPELQVPSITDFAGV